MSGSVWRFSMPWLSEKKVSAAGVGVEHAVVVAEHQDGVRQRGEQQIVLDVPALARCPARSRAASGSCGHLLGLRVERLPGRPAPRAASSRCTAAGARPCDARRGAAAARQIPADVLAGVAQAVPRPCSPACPATCADGDRALLGKRRRARIAPALQSRRRCAPASTARRRRRGPPSRRRRPRLRAQRRAVRIDDVAVDHDGDAHGLLDAAHEGPVGLALEELAARARMHGDELHARRPRRAAPAPARCGSRRPSRCASSA